MIGSDALGSVLGAAPVGDPERLVNIVRAMIRVGLSPVLNRPGTKEPICILSPAGAKKADTEARAGYIEKYPDRPADRINHACGFAHVLDDPAKVSVIVKRAQARYGDDLNVGLHLGRSRLLVADTDTLAEREAFIRSWDPTVAQLSAPPITVESPGQQDDSGAWVHKDGGHWYFTVPENFTFPEGKVVKGPGGWALMWGESQVLAPPSVRREGPYRLTGTPGPAPAWALDMITSAPVRETAQDFQVTPELTGNPIEQWSRDVPWAALLEPDGWSVSGTNTDCGCPNFRAPGDHASPKSATGHEAGCKIFDTSTGWGPLKIWTDHPPAGLPAEGAVTKFGYVACTRGLDTDRTKAMLGIPEWAPVSEAVMLDPKVMTGTGIASTVTGNEYLPLEDASAPGEFMDLGPYLDGTYRPADPSRGALRLDGIQVLYPGKWHTVIAPTGAGKTWFALWHAAHELRAGNCVIYAHFEERGPEGTISRLRSIGVTDDEMRRGLKWVNTSGPWPAQALTTRLAEMMTAGDAFPTLTILDGIIAAAGQHGWAVNDVEAVGKYQRAFVIPATALGSTVLSLGHPPKATDRQNERHGFGSTQWLDMMDGVGFRLEADRRTPISPGKLGHSVLYSVKDRYAGVEAHGVHQSMKGEGGWYRLGNFVVDSSSIQSMAGGLSAYLSAPDPDDAALDGSDGLDALCDAVAAFLDGEPGRRYDNQRSLRDSLRAIGTKFRNDDLSPALERMERDGSLLRTAVDPHSPRLQRSGWLP